MISKNVRFETQSRWEIANKMDSTSLQKWVRAGKYKSPIQIAVVEAKPLQSPIKLVNLDLVKLYLVLTFSEKYIN